MLSEKNLPFTFYFSLVAFKYICEYTNIRRKAELPRHRQIFKCIRVDDSETRLFRKEVNDDPSEAPQIIYNEFVSNCLDSYSPRQMSLLMKLWQHFVESIPS